MRRVPELQETCVVAASASGAWHHEELPPGGFRGDEELPPGGFRGDEELPPGGFRGDEELPPGGFRA